MMMGEGVWGGEGRVFVVLCLSLFLAISLIIKGYRNTGVCDSSSLVQY
jgi:hypothetical protein